MSELITRRTFLKATGAAALVAAAGSMLVGCGDGAYASTPENLVAPSIDNTDFAPLTLPITRDFLVVPLAWAHSAALLNQILCMKGTDVVTIISTPPLVFRV